MILTIKSQHRMIPRKMIHRFSVDGPGAQDQAVSVEPLSGGRFRVSCSGTTLILDARKVQSGTRSATWSLVPEGGGRTLQVDVDGAAPDLMVTVDNVTVPLKLTDARSQVAALARPQAAGPQPVRSPMPGKVVKVLVKAGDEVKAGAAVVVVEAMKMENELRAPRDGKVREVKVQEGQAVESNQTLATIE
jgi:biotin carboxyl carrier protein